MEKEIKIKKIKKRSDLYGIGLIYLSCVVMPNNEVIFNGKSLGFLTNEELQKWAFIDK